MRARRLPILAAAFLAACASEPPRASSTFLTASWPGAAISDAPYLLAPGDKVEIVVHTAPELSRELVVAPDGRVRMALADPVMAMALTPDELADALRAELASELIDPDLDVIVTGFASQKIFIGGEVRTPGLFDLPGEIDPLQAIVMAGGYTRSAQPREVLLIRRQPGGEIRSVRIDIKAGLDDPASAGWLPLRRFDVVYVPRSRIAKQNQFVRQYIRDALPLPFLIFYDVNG